MISISDGWNQNRFNMSLAFIAITLLLGWVQYVSYIENLNTCIKNGTFEININTTISEESSKEFLTEYQTEALEVPRQLKILCWILTMPKNHMKKAIHVKKTWGKRCDKLIFMSSQKDDSLPSIDLGFKESRDILWGKTKRAFQYVYKHHLDEYDWFMKADDDTYVIMENLRHLLSIYDPVEDPIYFGKRFVKFTNVTFMSGGAGYVLSRKALKIFIEKALPNPSLCKQSNIGAEDVEMGKCLDNTGVISGDSRDSSLRGKFFPAPPENYLVSGDLEPHGRYWNIAYYPIGNGTNCCSDLAISFHYIKPKKMYELEYLIYSLHPFGVKYSDTQLPPLPRDKNSIPTRMSKFFRTNSSRMRSKSSPGTLHLQ